MLTLTDFDVGLGNLKGDFGDQQCDIPDGANLRDYDTMIWSFGLRATATSAPPHAEG